MSGLDESRDTDTAATGDAVTPLVIQATPPAPPRFSPRTRDFLAWVALPPLVCRNDGRVANELPPVYRLGGCARSRFDSG